MTEREADPIARLRAMVDEATQDIEPPPAPYASYGRKLVERDKAWHRLATVMAGLSPELLAVVEAAEHEPRTNADGEVTTLAIAVDALRARAAEVTR